MLVKRTMGKSTTTNHVGQDLFIIALNFHWDIGEQNCCYEMVSNGLNILLILGRENIWLGLVVCLYCSGYNANAVGQALSPIILAKEQRNKKYISICTIYFSWVYLIGAMWCNELFQHDFRVVLSTLRWHYSIKSIMMLNKKLSR